MSRLHDDAIEERIHMEIIVDCYDEEEQTACWYCYLGDRLDFPFKAEVIVKRRNSPLVIGQMVEVTGMGDEDDCSLHEMWVDIRWQENVLSVPLSQLQPVDADEATVLAVDDWHYWVERMS